MGLKGFIFIIGLMPSKEEKPPGKLAFPGGFSVFLPMSDYCFFSAGWQPVQVMGALVSGLSFLSFL